MLKSPLGEDGKEQAAQLPALASGMTPVGASLSAVDSALPRHSRMADVQSYMDEKNEERWKAVQSEMATISKCQHLTIAGLKSSTLAISTQIHELSCDLGSQRTAPTSLTAATDDSTAFPFASALRTSHMDDSTAFPFAPALRTSHMDDTSLVGKDLETGLSQMPAFAKTSDVLPGNLIEKVSVLLSDVKSLLDKIKRGKCKSISTELLKLRVRVKATLSLEASVALTPTQQLALWRGYGSLSDTWIEGIGVVVLKKNKTQAEKIKVLQNDVYILCSAKYSELSETRTDTSSSLRTLPRLSRMGSMHSLESVNEDSITSIADCGHFIDSIDTDAMMASTKALRSAAFDEVQNVVESHYASESGRDPSVPLPTRNTSLSAESRNTFQCYAPHRTVSPVSATQTTRAFAETRKKKKLPWLRKPKKLPIRHKPKTQRKTESLKGGEVFLGYESPTHSRKDTPRSVSSKGTPKTESTSSDSNRSGSQKKKAQKRFSWLGL